MGLFEECHGCTDRVVGCHSKCEKYKNAKEKHDRLIADYAKDKDVDKYFYQESINRANRVAVIRKRKVTVRRNYK